MIIISNFCETFTKKMLLSRTRKKNFREGFQHCTAFAVKTPDKDLLIHHHIHTYIQCIRCIHCIHYTCTLACMHTCKQTSDITAPPNQPNTSPSHSFSIYLQILNENQFTYLPSYPPTCLRTYAPSYLLTYVPRTYLSACLDIYLSIDPSIHYVTVSH